MYKKCVSELVQGDLEFAEVNKTKCPDKTK